ncbi:MAG: DUF2587 domain-containing protein [Candidatus Rokubacteria bacterium]|nr:DUF2587 domain-containing protein [Candidatus Rokubacteria bacterium]
MDERDPEIVIPGQPSAGREREEFVSQPAKLLRIASMIRELLAEVRQSSLDEPGRTRLRAIYDRALAELKEGLSDDLQQELGTFRRGLSWRRCVAADCRPVPRARLGRANTCRALGRNPYRTPRRDRRCGRGRRRLCGAR